MQDTKLTMRAKPLRRALCAPRLLIVRPHCRSAAAACCRVAKRVIGALDVAQAASGPAHTKITSSALGRADRASTVAIGTPPTSDAVCAAGIPVNPLALASYAHHFDLLGVGRHGRAKAQSNSHRANVVMRCRARVLVAPNVRGVLVRSELSKVGKLTHNVHGHIHEAIAAESDDRRAFIRDLGR